MSHIAVERNRRRQMNEHLKSLRSLTPCFYIKRGDQASIIGGVIEFIKEMQQLVQVLESKKRRKTLNGHSFLHDHQTLESLANTTNATSRVPFSRIENVMTTSTFKEVGACCNSPHANVEAKISGSNVVLRVVSRRIEGQLVRIVSALEKLSFQVLHLNISSMEETVLYFFVVKIGLECHISLEDLTFEVQKSFVPEDVTVAEVLWCCDREAAGQERLVVEAVEEKA
ncbi:unnamed protein product [Eruca vesicaria subsp. sativa]|uniref:BHLH domain-containing protein n=1 Tax=Eruca vesicaria subsp. sativa TaxID=29727 RepID=A0ABC8K4F2_ERUVS|nr:unnamed protein product [Eruca vesicaria subsp. sativa]